jgi:DNA-binding NarL/FixJ family response regulator
LRGAIAFPALHLGEVIAVLEFYHDREPELIERLLPTMVAIGRELGEFFSRRGGELGHQHLTERQLRVLTLAAAGNTARQIAAELGLSTSTVRTHFDHIYEKLDVADRTAAVAQALRLGLIR